VAQRPTIQVESAQFFLSLTHAAAQPRKKVGRAHKPPGHPSQPHAASHTTARIDGQTMYTRGPRWVSAAYK
jgi:hypothetical protein